MPIGILALIGLHQMLPAGRTLSPTRWSGFAIAGLLGLLCCAAVLRRVPARWPAPVLFILAGAVHLGWTLALTAAGGSLTTDPGHAAIWAAIGAVRVPVLLAVVAGAGAGSVARAAAPMLALSPAAAWAGAGVADPASTVGLLAVGIALVAAGRRSAAWSLPGAVLAGLVLAGATVLGRPALWWGLAVLGVYFVHRRAQLQLVTGAATIVPLGVLDTVHRSSAGAVRLHRALSWTRATPLHDAALSHSALVGALLVLAAVALAAGPAVVPAVRGCARTPTWPLVLGGAVVVLAGLIAGGASALGWLPTLVVLGVAVAATPRPSAAREAASSSLLLTPLVGGVVVAILTAALIAGS